MAVFETTRSISEGASIFNRAASVAYHIVGAVTDWNAKRATRSALSKLSDRELDDIGLVRGDLENLR